jgi:hypothetical protein
VTAAVIVAIVSATIAACSLGYTVYDKRRALSKKLDFFHYSTSLRPGYTSFNLDQLSIMWGEKTLAAPRLLSVTVRNRGRVEVKRDEMSIPPRVQLSDARIISAEITLTPHGLFQRQVIAPANQTETSIEAPAVVLNPYDSLHFDLLIDGEEEHPRFVMQAVGFTIDQMPIFSESNVISIDQTTERAGNIRIAIVAAFGFLVIAAMLTAFTIWNNR